MLAWLRKIKLWHPSPDKDITIHNYGRYVHRPVLQRALSMVTGLTQTDLVNRMYDGVEIYLNGDKLHATHLVLRLDPGEYQVDIPELYKRWLFFIK